MKLTRVTVALILALALYQPLSALPQQSPLTKQQVVNLVKNQFGEKTGARSIELRGIDFEPTQEFLDSLKDAGADDLFIQALRSARRAGQPVGKKPMNQTQVLLLLAGQVPSHRVGILVDERGLDFEPQQDFLNEVSRSGGDQELLNTLRKAKVIKAATSDPKAAATEAEVRQHINRTIEFQQKGQFGEAEQEIRAAAKLWPQDAVIMVDLASILAYQAKWDDSYNAAREAARLDPQNSGAHVMMGVALGGKNDINRATPEFHEALRLDPNDDSAHYNLGVALMIKNDSDGAMAQYREALRLNPKNASAHYALGKRLEFDKSDRKGALEEYRAAYTLSPTDGAFKSNYERLSRELNP